MNDAVMDVKNVLSWVQQFKEGRTLCENKQKEPRPRTSRSEDMIVRVERKEPRPRTSRSEDMIVRVEPKEPRPRTSRSEDMIVRVEPKEPRPRTSRSEDMIARVEQMVLEDRRLTVKQIDANAGISVGSVDTILNDDLKMREVSARWVPRIADR